MERQGLSISEIIMKSKKLKQGDGNLKLKRVFVCFLALLVIFIGAMSMQANPTTDELVATVNGVDITVEEFFQALEEQGGAIVLERLIRNILMVQKQEELGIDVDEDLLEHQWVMI